MLYLLKKDEELMCRERVDSTERNGEEHQREG